MGGAPTPPPPPEIPTPPPTPDLKPGFTQGATPADIAKWGSGRKGRGSLKILKQGEGTGAAT